MSKRHGAAGVLEYRDAGFLPEAVINYLVRLGWSYKDQEIFSREEMIQHFDANSLQRAPAALNPEKLAWLNQHYIKTLDKKTVAHALAPHMEKEGLQLSNGPLLTDIVSLFAERVKTLVEMAKACRFFYLKADQIVYDDQALNKHFNPEVASALSEVVEQFRSLMRWEADEIHQIIRDVGEKRNLNLGKIAQPLRLAVTGGVISPPIDQTLYYLGREQTVQRIERCLT